MINTEDKNHTSTEGFSLIELTVSMVILLVALLSIVSAVNFSITYNSGNNARSQALTLLQQEAEQLRSLKFTSTAMDARLAGGVKTPKLLTMANGNRFRILITVDDDPFTGGVQVNNNKTLKEITVKVENMDVSGNDWRQGMATETILRRVRGN